MLLSQQRTHLYQEEEKTTKKERDLFFVVVGKKKKKKIFLIFFSRLFWVVVVASDQLKAKQQVCIIIASLSSSSHDDYKKCLRSPPPNLLASESSPRRRRRRNRSTRSYRYAKKRERASLKRFDDVSLSLSLLLLLMEFFLSLSRDWITSPFVIKVFAVVEKNRAMRVCTRTPRMVMVAMRVEGRFCLRTRARTYRSCAALSPSITTFFRTMALDISITDISFTLLSFEYEWERAERLHDRHRQTQKSV